MNSTAFDTLAAARELEAAGIERRHADAIAAITRRAAAADRETQATKADIAGLDARLASHAQATKADIAGLDARLASHAQATKADIAGLDARLAGLEARIYRALWIQGAGIVAIVGGFIAIAAALRLFGA